MFFIVTAATHANVAAAIYLLIFYKNFEQRKTTQLREELLHRRAITHYYKYNMTAHNGEMPVKMPRSSNIHVAGILENIMEGIIIHMPTSKSVCLFEMNNDTILLQTMIG